jgi:histidyl-tRNA synthetase
VAKGEAGVKALRGVAAEARNEQQTVALEHLTEYLINAMVASAEDGDD